MDYLSRVSSPLGPLVMTADDSGLTGLRFEGQRFFSALFPSDIRETNDLPVFRMTSKSSSEIHALPQRRLVSPSHYPLRRDPDLRRDRRHDVFLRLKRDACLSTGRRRRGGTQSHRPDHSLSPCHRRLRPPDRLCRRAGPESPSSGPGTGSDPPRLPGSSGIICTMTGRDVREGFPAPGGTAEFGTVRSIPYG